MLFNIGKFFQSSPYLSNHPLRLLSHASLLLCTRDCLLELHSAHRVLLSRRVLSAMPAGASSLAILRPTVARPRRATSLRPESSSPDPVVVATSWYSNSSEIIGSNTLCTINSGYTTCLVRECVSPKNHCRPGHSGCSRGFRCCWSPAPRALHLSRRFRLLRLLAHTSLLLCTRESLLQLQRARALAVQPQRVARYRTLLFNSSIGLELRLRVPRTLNMDDGTGPLSFGKNHCSEFQWHEAH